MAKIIKRVLVEFEFESTTEETPYIKDWWLRNQVEKAIKYATPGMKERITTVTIEHLTTNILPDEITVKMEDILCQS